MCILSPIGCRNLLRKRMPELTRDLPMYLRFNRYSILTTLTPATTSGRSCCKMTRSLGKRRDAWNSLLIRTEMSCLSSSVITIFWSGSKPIKIVFAYRSSLTSKENVKSTRQNGPHMITDVNAEARRGYVTYLLYIPKIWEEYSTRASEIIFGCLACGCK